MKTKDSFKFYLAVSFLAASLYAGKSFAAADSGFLLDVSLLPVIGTRTDTDSTTTSPGVAPEGSSGADVKATIGYIFSPKIFVGFTYGYNTLTSTRTAVAGGSESLDEKIVKTEIGPTIGYFHNGWRFLATYFMKGQQDKEVVNKNSDGSLSGKSNYVYSDMSGFQLAVGYTFAFNQHFAIGPTLIYRSTAYASQAKTNAMTTGEDYGATTLHTAKAESSLSPLLALEFRF